MSLVSTTPASAAIVAPWRASFVDAVPALAEIFTRLHRADDPPLHVNRQLDVNPDELPVILGGAPIAIVDHTPVPTAVAVRCPGLKHIVFLGTGARSYMEPEALAALGITVHTIKGYGDTAVAECAFALMWAAARGLARMDRELREGRWVRTDGMQLRGKTLWPDRLRWNRAGACSPCAWRRHAGHRMESLAAGPRRRRIRRYRHAVGQQPRSVSPPGPDR